MTKKKKVEETEEEVVPAGFEKPLYTGHSEGHVLLTSDVVEEAEEAETTEETE